MTKKNLMPTVVLGIICIAVAAVLALVNGFTAPIIAEATVARQQASLKEVLPAATEFEKLELDSLPETVLEVYRDKGGSGYALLLSTSSQYTSGDNMGITVAVNPDGEITGIKLTTYTESKDFGKAVYPASYIGENAEEVAVHHTTAGVTYSSKALRGALSDALKALADNNLLNGGNN